MQHERIRRCDSGVDAVCSQYRDTWRIKGADITWSGGERGCQIYDPVHQHQGEEAYFEGKSLHEVPVFDGFEQPDQDRSDQYHEQISRRAERSQALEKAKAELGNLLSEPCRNQTLIHPLKRSLGPLRIDGHKDEQYHRHEKRDDSQNRQVVEIADQAGIDAHSSKLGKVDHYK